MSSRFSFFLLILLLFFFLLTAIFDKVLMYHLQRGKRFMINCWLMCLLSGEIDHLFLSFNVLGTFFFGNFVVFYG